MNFGSVSREALDLISFALAPEPEENLLVLGKAPKGMPVIRIGCPRWGSKYWIGKIYPGGAKEKDFLSLYPKHFNAVELNATHYRIYTSQEIQAWLEKCGNADIKFCPKFPQLISHYSGFKDTGALTASFLEGVKAFGANLGPLFLQLSEQFSPDRRAPLFSYLKSLPPEFCYFLEVRHPDWFRVEKTRQELFEFLETQNMGAVITDSAGRRDAVHMRLTLPVSFVRFVANSLHPTDYSRLDEWAERIRVWIQSGLTEIYFFIHQPEEALAPELALYFAEKLQAKTGLLVHKPSFIQAGLF